MSKSPKNDLLPSALVPPQATMVDKAIEALRAVVSLYPEGGSLASELIGLILTPPIEKRRNQWMEEVARNICRLNEEKRLRIEDLPENEAFVDTVLHATQAAVRTASATKRLALRNAVLNSALPDPPEETKRQMFVGMIDDFSDWHLRLLALFRNPRAFFESQSHPVPEYAFTGSLIRLLGDAYPESAGQEDLLDLVAKDLHRRGLMGPDGLRAMISARGVMERSTTSLGDEFLKFIESPCHEHDQERESQKT